jgi:hypothetical protein
MQLYHAQAQPLLKHFLLLHHAMVIALQQSQG